MTLKRNVATILLLLFSLPPLFSQAPMMDTPALKLDLSLFNLPYQVHAAQTLEYGFFESYTHPDMDFSLNVTAGMYSSFHYGMKRLKDKIGVNEVWQYLLCYGGIVVGDYFIYLAPVTTSYLWMHESFHRAGFTYAGVRSHINYDFPKAGYTMPDSGYIKSPESYIRTISAGLESEYLLQEKMQVNNFFYEQDMFNEFFYWLSNYQAWSYAYMPFLLEGMTITVEGKEQEVSSDSLVWAWFLFQQDEVSDWGLEESEDDGEEEALKLSDLRDHEKKYLKTRAMLSLLNLASPMMFGIRSIPLGKDNGISGNFAIRHLYTSFGTDLSANVYLKMAPFNMVFALHFYQNYEHVFPTLEARLVDFPIRFRNWGLYISPRIMIGMQPVNHEFRTKYAEFFGLLGARVDFAVNKHFLPYMELTAKTDGWVAGNEYLERNVSLRVGLSARF
jgi:hypothetical protein